MAPRAEDAPSARTPPAARGGGVAGMRRVRHLVYLLALLCAATLAGTRGAALLAEREAARERAATSAAGLARVVEEYARRTFGGAALTAGIVADGVARRGGVAALAGSEEAHRWLRAIADRPETGDHVIVVDAGGVLLASSHAFPAPPTPLGDRRWFQAHRGGAGRYVGEALFSRVTDEILFTYSEPLRGPDGSLEGVVQVAMRPLGLFQEAGLGTTFAAREARLALWTLDGRVVARTGLAPGEIDGLRLPDAVAPPDRRAETGLHQGPGPLGEEQILAWRRLEDWPVVATAGVAVADALAGYRASLAASLGLGGALLAVLGGLTWLVHLAGRREERTLAALAAANAALREARDGLEARVAGRTAELAEANRRLAEREARYRGLFNTQFQFIGLLAPDGTLLEANRAALEFGGLRAGEVIGRPFWEARWWDTGEETRARLRDAIRRAAAGEFIRHEVEVRGAGEARATIDFSLTPVRDDATGAVTLLVPEGRDITELKAAQAQLREAQKLETLGQLTGGVAHDFNNLLMAVMGNLSLLRRRLAGQEDPRLLRLVDGAVQGAERGAALTQRLLAFARRQELRPEPVDLARLIPGMADLLRRSLGPAVRVTLDVPADLPPVLADANQLEMALLNLALNARDAMPGGGSLRIEARRAEAGAGGPGARQLRIGVADTGTGMDEATLRRAAEPFFTTKGPGKGSGLGLSMVHGLAAQSGGRLEIRSRPGAGTAVDLFLPVAAAARAHPPALDAGAAAGLPASAPGEGAAAAAAPAACPLSILLVDDDLLVQASTAAMLEDLGHRVTTASSGQAALDLLAGGGGDGGAVDLMITDFAMPGMDGLRLRRRAQALRPGLPVILATGYAELAEGEDTALAADLPRLAKPYRQDALAEAIARAMAGRTPPPPPAAPSDNVVHLRRPPTPPARRAGRRGA